MLSSFLVGRTRAARQKTQDAKPAAASEQGRLTTTVLGGIGSNSSTTTRSNSCGVASNDDDDNIWTASGGPRQQELEQQQAPPSQMSSLSSSSSNYYSFGRRKKSRRRFPQQASKKQQQPRTKSYYSGSEDDDVFPQPEPVNMTKKVRTDDPAAAPTTARGVGVDVYDLQDHGQLQMLTDEVSFLCDGIWQNPQSGSTMELLWLLSLDRNRQILWKSTNNGGGVALKVVLDLLSHLPMALQTGNSEAESSQVGASKKDKDLDTEKDIDANYEFRDHLLPFVVKHENRSSSSSYQVTLLRIAEVLWHFISLDCTWTPSPTSLERARSLRLTILSHQAAMSGLVQLALLGQGSQMDTNSPDGQGNRGARRESPLPLTPTRTNAVSKSVADAIDPNSPESESSQASKLSADPTIAGRKRRRTRPRPATQSEPSVPPSLSIIQEEQQCNNMEEEDEKKNFTGLSTEQTVKNDLSYASSLSSTNLIIAENHGRDASTRHAIQLEQWTTILKRVLDTMSKEYMENRHTTCATFSVNIPSQDEARAASKLGHRCENKAHLSEPQAHQQLPPNFALLALQRILTGRLEGHEKSSLDESCHKKDKDKRSEYTNEGEDESNNPLIVTNRLLADNEQVIVLLAKAMAHAVKEATRHARPEQEETGVCALCVESLHERIAILASIIDGACLFHDGNRRAFCNSSFALENKQKSSLVPYLVGFLKTLLNRGVHGRGDGDSTDSSNTNRGPLLNLFNGTVSWIGGACLEVLKTLTSLTHENPEAIAVVNKAGGWQVLAQLLFQHKAAISLPDRHDDMAIFALNTLANLVESSVSASSNSSSVDQSYCSILAQLKVVDNEARKQQQQNVPFLSWLVKHLVDLTGSFRDDLMDVVSSQATTSSSSPPPKQADSEMADEVAFLEHDRDNLLLAGNGFVLLAYLLVGPAINNSSNRQPQKRGEEAKSPSSHSNNSNNKEAFVLLENIILNGLPGNMYTCKIRFLQKVLYAFCNFYRHTVGELSVAIIAPVQSLMQVLSAKVQRPAAVAVTAAQAKNNEQQ
ncbi:hypothetical protein ACA910_017373 [Epithemia clementina (nom. ined.)]